MLLLLIPLQSFSQTYKCQFLRYANSQIIDVQTEYHKVTLKEDDDIGVTSISYSKFDGIELELEILYEDGNFEASLYLIKNDTELLWTSYFAKQKYPEEFLLSYEVSYFIGEATCILH